MTPEVYSKFAPEIGPGFERKLFFQPSIFRAYASFRECNGFSFASKIESPISVKFQWHLMTPVLHLYYITTAR